MKALWTKSANRNVAQASNSRPVSFFIEVFRRPPSQRDGIIQPRHLRYSGKRFFIVLFTGFDRWCGEEFVAAFLEGSQIACFIIGLAVLPHAPDDALPFIGQLADRFVMVHFFCEIPDNRGPPKPKI